MSDLEKILERTAREIVQHGDINFVLRERLLPLLQAGQTMRDWKPAWEDGQAWDAAKRKGME